MRNESTAGIPVLLAASCLILVTSIAAAAPVSLGLSPSSSFRQGHIHVSVAVENLGRVPAYSLLMQASLAGQQTDSGIVPVLQTNRTTRFEFSFDNTGLPRGEQIAVFRLHYTDANGYPFSALSAIPVLNAVIEDMSDPVEITLAPCPVDEHGILRADLSSTRPDPLTVTVRVVLPDELTASPDAQVVTLTDGTVRRVTFEVASLIARPGSSYRAMAIARCEDGGVVRSTTARSYIQIRSPAPGLRARWWFWPTVMAVLAILAAVLETAIARNAAHGPMSPRVRAVVRLMQRATGPAVLLVLLLYTLHFLPVGLLLSDTMTTGGDTPAHPYLAGHLQTQLFEHGRIVSWAGGWWGGFPMFQFYFPLPYLAMALLGSVIPLSIAFKLVSVAGVLLLPLAAYLFARLLRLPRPVPGVLAIAMVPYLFVQTHTMWGVSIYSTLAGMIANSISFAIMLLALGCAYRDAQDGRFRIHTVLLLAALIASHFFTSVMAVALIALAPFFRPRAGVRRALAVVTMEGATAALLMAWWLVPLIAKIGYTVDFGSNWDIVLWRSFPVFSLVPAVLLPVALIVGYQRRERAVALLLAMLVLSLALFLFGYDVSHVFVNVRLWPFMFFALLGLGAYAIGWVLHRMRLQAPAVCIVLIAALVYGVQNPRRALDWSRWNYSGLSGKPLWPVIRDLVLPLDGTSGRLANDLNEANLGLGSSRVFESVPQLIDKPILEGGIVSSAIGSLFAYTIQGESSKASAGFPNLVTPAPFDIDAATRHLELFNVKHFVARDARTQAALAAHPDWVLRKRSLQWELYELTSHDGRYVIVPPHPPVAMITDDPDRTSLAWFREQHALAHPMAFFGVGKAPAARFDRVLDEASFPAFLAECRAEPIERAGTPDAVIEEHVEDMRIRFRTSAVGRPHIIKCNYYPNWRVRGAAAVYRVTPNFMLVYPNREEVELYYGYTLSDNVGRVLTAAAVVMLVALGIKRTIRHA